MNNLFLSFGIGVIILMIIIGIVVWGNFYEMYNTIDNVERKIHRLDLELTSFEKLLGYRAGMTIISDRVEFIKDLSTE